MDMRKIGELEVTPVGYGCMGISHAHGYALEHDDAVRTVREAYEVGYTYFDTATTYMGTTRSGAEAINEVMDVACQARRDPDTSPEELAETMGELIAEGKVRYWGISEVEDADYLRRAHAVTPISTIQNKLNMSVRGTEELSPAEMDDIDRRLAEMRPETFGVDD